MSKLTVLLAALVALAALGVASGASAKGGGGAVLRTGSCSANANWKLKVKPEDGALEIEFQVDQNVAGRAWKVVIRQNGVRRFRGVRTTKAPSGSFTVRRIVDDKSGADRIVAKARALATGQTCRGELTV
jgi:hypothetical protein